MDKVFFYDFVFNEFNEILDISFFFYSEKIKET